MRMNIVFHSLKWTQENVNKMQLSVNVKYFITCAPVCDSIKQSVFFFFATKRLWRFETLHYSSLMKKQSMSKRKNINLLKRQYEMFRMNDHQSIDEMFGGFGTILIEIYELQKEFTTEEINMKLIPPSQ